MAKGGEFERELSKFLSLWWTYGERDDVFWRTSASGARATTRASAFKKTKYEHGDITFTDPIAKPVLDLMVIEAKRGYTNTSKKSKVMDMTKVCLAASLEKDPAKIKPMIQRLFSKTKKSGGVDLLDMIDSKAHHDNLPLAQWILKGEVDRAQANVPYFILIGRRDNRNSFVLMPYDLLARLEKWQAPVMNDPLKSSMPYHLITLDIGIDKYFMCHADTFFNWLEPETVKALAKQRPHRRFV